MRTDLVGAIFLRAHTEPAEARSARRTPRVRWRRPDVGHRLLVVAMDGEERGAHPLRCAMFRVLSRRADGTYERAAPLVLSAPSEGIVLGPALPRREGARLRAWARAHRLATLTVQDWVHDVLLPEVYVEGTLGVAWDWGALFGSVASRWGRGARSPKTWTLTLCPLHARRQRRRSHNPSAHPDCPQVRVRALTEPYVQHVEWASPRRRRRWGVPHFSGRFLGLHGALFVLSAEDHTLGSACRTCGIAAPEGDADAERVEDLLAALASRLGAEAALAQAVDRELLRHTDIVSRENEVRRRRHRVPRLSVCDLRTPTTLGKAYLRAMGIEAPPRLEVSPGLGLSVSDVHGAAMAAFYPGAARCAIRHVPVAGLLCDVRSEYPTVATLLGAWSWWTAARVVVEDATEHARALLEGVTPEVFLRPEPWRGLGMLCCVEPDGDYLPARLAAPGVEDDDEAVFDGSLTVPAHLGPLWYPLADCLRSRFRTGRPPRVLRAVQFRPEGRRDGLRGVLFGGEEPLLPDRDLFRDLVEVRHRLARGGQPHLAQAAKVMVNALAFGIAAELHRQDRGRRVVVYDGVRRFPARPRVWELAGPFYTPPLAALVTGAGRLMLHLLEHLVREAGGECAMVSTDCVFVVAPDPAAVYEAVRDRLEPLNPYSTVRPLLRVDAAHEAPPRPLTYFGVAVNRYALYQDRSAGHRPPRIVKPSGQVIGSLLDPTTRRRSRLGEGIPAWWREAWTWGIQSVRPGHPAAGPGWLDDPAPYVLTLTTPEQAGPLRHVAGGPRPFQQVLLLGSRMMSGAVAVAPLLPGPIPSLPWADARTGRRVRLMGDGDRPFDFMPETYRRLLSDHLRHADPKVPGGNRRGRLDGAWHVRAERLGWRGKETLVPAGRDDLGALLGVEPVRYEPGGREALGPALQTLRALPHASWPALAHRLGLSARRLRDVLSERASPRPARVPRIVLLADGIGRNGGSLPDGAQVPRGRGETNGRRGAGSPRPATRKAVPA